MSTPSFRLHGDAPLIDPELLKGYCSDCKHEREWRVVKTDAEKGTFVKACETCGLRVRAKLPPKKKDEMKEVFKEGNIIEKVVNDVRRELNKLIFK